MATSKNLKGAQKFHHFTNAPSFQYGTCCSMKNSDKMFAFPLLNMEVVGTLM